MYYYLPILQLTPNSGRHCPITRGNQVRPHAHAAVISFSRHVGIIDNRGIKIVAARKMTKSGYRTRDTVTSPAIGRLASSRDILSKIIGSCRDCHLTILFRLDWFGGNWLPSQFFNPALSARQHIDVRASRIRQIPFSWRGDHTGCAFLLIQLVCCF